MSQQGSIKSGMKSTAQKEESARDFHDERPRGDRHQNELGAEERSTGDARTERRGTHTTYEH